MNWTKDKPTEPGWYFVRNWWPGLKQWSSEDIVYVEWDEFWVEGRSLRVIADEADSSLHYDQWAGPIPLPEELK